MPPEEPSPLRGGKTWIGMALGALSAFECHENLKPSWFSGLCKLRCFCLFVCFFICVLVVFGPFLQGIISF